MQDGLNDFLEQQVASLQKLKAVDRNGAESFKTPQVVRSGWILPHSADEDNATEEDFPFIMTRIEKIEHEKGARQSVVTMLIIFGVYDPGVYDENGKLVDDGSGYRDFWNLLEATRQTIFLQHIIDNKYRVHDDFYEATMLDEQGYPYWQGYCRLKFDVMFVAPKLDESFF
jgi:hypothetical protein